MAMKSGSLYVVGVGNGKTPLAPEWKVGVWPVKLGRRCGDGTSRWGGGHGGGLQILITEMRREMPFVEAA